jgi:predicted nucleic acid-binding OB-fold protein
MKFYNELSSIETQIYKLETLRAIVSLKHFGVEL